ncbi:glutamate receptor 2.7-like [Canna indica]|uniref:Glutamate receptor n=1 Tax=Canna indica TaxID=4628 RepID=A0AAQ3QQC1_9LILI|nr:glutamate receptor 2.7-like [Canna indica]
MERSTQFTLLICSSFVLAAVAQNGSRNLTALFHVGVILDLSTLVGKMGMTSISMAVEDFYAMHRNYTSRLVLHTKDSRSDVIQAASAAQDLIENYEVEAIVGPQKSSQAIFVAELGDKSHVPIISFSATSPTFSSLTPYFIRTTLNDSSQVSSISSIIKAYGWREVVLIYEDTEYGRGIIPYLIDSLQGVETRVPYRSVIPISATDDQIMIELYKLMTMRTRVFILHMTPIIGSRLFLKAKEAGMMSEGFVWILSTGLTNIIDSLDPSVTDTMQGALGVKLYVPKTRKFNDFATRWKRRFLQDHPSDEPSELSIYALSAYDTIWAVAMAVQKVGMGMLGASMNGPKLLEAILMSKFEGLSGDFYIIDGQVQYSTFQIINVVGKGGRGIGFWTPEHGITRQLNNSITKGYSTSMTDLNTVIWPGDYNSVPKGWEIPVSGKKLRIGVPVTQGVPMLMNVETDPVTHLTIASGYCIDVFESAITKLPYAIPYEYVPFQTTQGKLAGSYNDLVYQVYLQKFDAVVGDVTIRYNRSLYVDFTLPFTESGVSMIVPVTDGKNMNAWIFLQPLTLELWLGSLAFFIFTGFVIWIMEHRINTDFRGPFSHQLGTIFYFSFSTLVFSHREKIESNLSKLVVIVWVFVVLVLTSSYTASLTSMLTVQQLQPTVTNVHELLKNGDYVGYPRNSFVEILLKQLNFEASKMRAYDDSVDEYFMALSRGSKNGGVSAVVHEIPYIKFFLAKHCTGFTMVGPIYKTAGFGFVFPKGSPLVPDVSRAILNLTDGDSIIQIEKKWFGDQKTCLNQGSIIISAPNSLSFCSFWGLFLITGVVSISSLFMFFIMFLYKNWHELRTIDTDKSVWQRFRSWARYYNKKDMKSYTFRIGKPDNNTSPSTSIMNGDSNVKASTGDNSPNMIIHSCDLYTTYSPPVEESSSPELSRTSTEDRLVNVVVSH